MIFPSQHRLLSCVLLLHFLRSSFLLFHLKELWLDLSSAPGLDSQQMSRVYKVALRQEFAVGALLRGHSRLSVDCLSTDHHKDVLGV